MASDELPPQGPAGPWPAVTHESLPWALDLDGGASRAARRRHQGRFLAAVPAVVAPLRLDLPGDLAAAVEDATVEITRFDTEMGGEIAPFSAVLLRSESAASSRIENLTATARAIAEAELIPPGPHDSGRHGIGRHGSGRRNAAEIVANTRTMSAALALAGSLDADAILAMHAALMSELDPQRAGRWRTAQVWVGGSDLGPHQAQYVAPHHSRIEPALADLVDYIARDDVPVLVQAAVAHAQFETIHPFPDGNGRTGRALVQAMLLGKGLTRNVTVPVSAGLLADTDVYFESLQTYRLGDPFPIVDQFCIASFRAVANGRRLVEDLRDIRRGWQESLRARSDSTVWRLLELLLRRPVLNAQAISTELDVTIGNVSRYVRPLLDAGIVTQASAQRNQVWRSVEVLAALDAFAARAGRRLTPFVALVNCRCSVSG